MLANSIFAAILLVVSIALIVVHFRRRRVILGMTLNDSEVDFYRVQHRRRVQTSGMIGVIGIAVFAGIWIGDGMLAAVYWLVVLVLAVWIILLALADAASSRTHFAHLRNDQLQEQAALHAEIRGFVEQEAQQNQEDGDSEEELL